MSECNQKVLDRQHNSGWDVNYSFGGASRVTPRDLPCGRGEAPGHAWGVVGQADAAVGAEEDDAAVAAEPVVEVGDGVGGGLLRGGAGGTRSTAHLPRTSFMMGSPQPVSETAAERLSA